MRDKKHYKMTVELRRSRRFSDGFKKSKVLEIETGKSTVSEVVKQYEVSSTNVYRWLAKFGSKKKTERLVMELDSDTKKLLELRKRLAEMERIIGQKQLLIDFQTKMIELAEEEYNIDIKKKYSSKLSGFSESTESDTTSV